MSGKGNYSKGGNSSGGWVPSQANNGASGPDKCCYTCGENPGPANPRHEPSYWEGRKDPADIPEPYCYMGNKPNGNYSKLIDSSIAKSNAEAAKNNYKD